jgi:hypothetical protein
VYRSARKDLDDLQQVKAQIVSSPLPQKSKAYKSIQGHKLKKSLERTSLSNSPTRPPFSFMHESFLLKNETVRVSAHTGFNIENVENKDGCWGSRMAGIRKDRRV